MESHPRRGEAVTALGCEQEHFGRRVSTFNVTKARMPHKTRVVVSTEGHLESHVTSMWSVVSGQVDPAWL